MRIKLAHSPDADDAFMFYGLANGLIDTPGYEFEHILRDIQTLNDAARQDAPYELTAISYFAYPAMASKYELLRAGSSMGDGYGPLLVFKASAGTKTEMLNRVLDGSACIAVPGLQTSAYATLKLFAPKCNVLVTPFDRIGSDILSGVVDSGIIIHEGQLSYREEGLAAIVDLGVWWAEQTGGLPLPLGCNVVRSDLSASIKQDLSKIMRESIKFSLANRQDALKYALKYGRNLPENLADRFVGMYVNDLTVDIGERGLRGTEEFYERLQHAGLIASKPVLSFI